MKDTRIRIRRRDTHQVRHHRRRRTKGIHHHHLGILTDTVHLRLHPHMVRLRRTRGTKGISMRGTLRLRLHSSNTSSTITTSIRITKNKMVVCLSYEAGMLPSLLSTLQSLPAISVSLSSLAPFYFLALNLIKSLPNLFPSSDLYLD